MMCSHASGHICEIKMKLNHNQKKKGKKGSSKDRHVPRNWKNICGIISPVAGSGPVVEIEDRLFTVLVTLHRQVLR